MNRSSQHWIVTEVDILKFAVMLMCISGMMQSSVLFVSWSIVYDGLKYMIPVLGALIVMLRNHFFTVCDDRGSLPISDKLLCSVAFEVCDF